MKTTDRVRKHIGKSSRLPQSKTERNGKADQVISLPPNRDDAVHPSCLCVFDRTAQSPALKILLSEQEFLDCVKLCAGGEGLAGFIADAVREKMKRVSPSGRAKGPILDPFDIALAHVALPDSLSERKKVLQALSYIITPHHSASQGVSDQLAAIEQIEMLGREMPRKFDGIA